LLLATADGPYRDAAAPNGQWAYESRYRRIRSNGFGWGFRAVFGRDARRVERPGLHPRAVSRHRRDGRSPDAWHRSTGRHAWTVGTGPRRALDDAVRLAGGDGRAWRFLLAASLLRSGQDAGWLAIKHVNYTGTGSGNVEQIYNSSLGSFVYSNGDTEIAYQGGGVWRSDGVGEPRMISPPEFHFREATLTLPIITVEGQASGSGGVSAVVSSTGTPRNVFPNATSSGADGVGAPYNGSNGAYQNPVENGTVYAWVHSEYYVAWANYFRQRTSGNVTVYDANETVRLNLESLGRAPGEFTPPEPGGTSVEAGAVGNNHPIEEFTLGLEVDNNFNNAHWSLWSDSGSNELEIQVISHDNCKGGGFDGDVTFRYYYKNTSTGEHEEWKQRVSEDSSNAVDADCRSNKEGTLNIDFTATDTDMEYTDFDASSDSGNKDHFPDGMNEQSDDPATIDQHGSIDPGTVDYGDTKTINWTTNHYFSRMPGDIELNVDAGPGGSNRIDEPASTGELSYEETTGSKYITFLHITENDVEIDVE
jgi:hypothetical protein